MLSEGPFRASLVLLRAEESKSRVSHAVWPVPGKPDQQSSDGRASVLFLEEPLGVL